MPTGFPKNGVNKGWFKKGEKNFIPTDEQKENSRKRMIGNKLALGRKFSKESIEKISKAKTGKKRKPFSVELRRKMRENNLGSKSRFWKGGITPENDKARRSLEYKLWRKACFERDNFTCQKTGQIGGDLQVHHINNFSEFKELRTSINNGITLSKNAHKEFHNIYGIKNNTDEQIKKFLDKK
jgi:hypothetical protein